MSLYFDLGANRSLSNLDAEGEEKFTDKQDTLVSGENIKTINGVSVLGEGNIEVGEGGRITVNQTYDPTSSYAQSGTAVADAISTRANVGLNNLNASGQMVIDSQNGTISNCILEIPQNIKLTLENNVLTLKSGSILTKTGSTYATLTTTTDRTYTISSNQGAGKYVVLCQQDNGTIDSIVKVNDIHSGTTAQRPEDVSIGYKYFNVDTKQWNLKVSSAWNDNWAICYPICVIDVDSNHVASFAKDSNGNDMIFNGAGFIGHHMFVYPQTPPFALMGNGFEDGKLSSLNPIQNSLQIIEMSAANSASGYEKVYYFGITGGYISNNYREVDTIAERDTDTTNFRLQYVKETNKAYYHTANGFEERQLVKLLSYSYDGTIVTAFTIRQPYEGARNLLTDDIEATVSGKLDKVTTVSSDFQLYQKNPDGTQSMRGAQQGESGANTIPIRTGDGTLRTATPVNNNDATNKSYVDGLLATYTGYDATATQTLKNINGVLQWVTD